MDYWLHLRNSYIKKIKIFLNLLLKIKGISTYLVRSLYLAVALFGMLKCFAPHPIDFHPHLGRRMKYGKYLLHLLNIYYIPDTVIMLYIH